MQKINNKGFTLIELLVVIAIITIMTIWASSMNFNTTSDKQNLDRHMIKIVSYIETIRNNALLGKWIWVNLEVPNSYKIDFSLNDWWKTQWYYTDSWSIEHVLDFMTPPTFSWSTLEYIKNIECVKLNWDADALSTTWSILITWSNLQLGWCPEDSHKILQLNITRKAETESIQINTVTWLIKVLD